MIVYGDPGQERQVGEVLEEMHDRIDRLVGERDLEAVRGMLIEAGRLEQAITDIGYEPMAERLTDALAEEFLRVWSGGAFKPHACIEPLTRLSGWRDERVYMKVPEGFAFYTLYPEQYAVAAKRWAHDIGATRRVLVVGIRSIGTTLSAVVTAMLRQCGCNARRLTVRPTGHPYDRRASVDHHLVQGAQSGLIVDEGPGRSGSSFVAVGRALVEAGMTPEQVVFFPGHTGMPGEEGSEEIRRWWKETRRVTVSMAELRWGGRSLWEELALQTSNALGAAADGIRCEEASGGQWREMLNVDAPSWSAFERTKFREMLPDGRAVLWKFAGLDGGATRDERMLRRRERWTSRCIGRRRGFVGVEWVDGRLLSTPDLTTDLLKHIGRYVGAISTERLSLENVRGAVQRLHEMMRCNVDEALGEEEAREAEAWTERIGEDRLIAERRIAGDGRMGPWEWVRRQDGSLVKVDAQGHDVDHTCIGQQPLGWDVGGAAVEWGMNSEQRRELMKDIGLFDDEVGRWFCAAYAAFRVGMSAMCGVGDEQYRKELLRAIRPAG